MATEKKPRPKGVNVQIELDEDIAQGVYSNLTVINHTETEFALDFVYVQPNQSKAKVRSRVIMSPRHTRRFLRAFQRNIEIYEKKFGPLPKPKSRPMQRPPGDDSIVH